MKFTFNVEKLKHFQCLKIICVIESICKLHSAQIINNFYQYILYINLANANKICSCKFLFSTRPALLLCSPLIS